MSRWSQPCDHKLNIDLKSAVLGGRCKEVILHERKRLMQLATNLALYLVDKLPTDQH